MKWSGGPESRRCETVSSNLASANTFSCWLKTVLEIMNVHVMHYVAINTIRPDVTYFIITLCLTPDDSTRQRKSADTQWVEPNNLPIHPLNPLSGNACTLTYQPTLPLYSV